MEAIELGNRLRAAAPTLTYVPDLDAPFATGVNVFGRIRDRHRADHFAVSESIYLARVSGYSRGCESVGWKRYRLHLSVAQYVEAVGSASERITYKKRTVPILLEEN